MHPRVGQAPNRRNVCADVAPASTELARAIACIDLMLQLCSEREFVATAGCDDPCTCRLLYILPRASETRTTGPIDVISSLLESRPALCLLKPQDGYAVPSTPRGILERCY
jgi:hypothetical protein